MEIAFITVFGNETSLTLSSAVLRPDRRGLCTPVARVFDADAASSDSDAASSPALCVANTPQLMQTYRYSVAMSWPQLCHVLETCCGART
jgi:hypothetical protein